MITPACRDIKPLKAASPTFMVSQYLGVSLSKCVTFEMGTYFPLILRQTVP